MALKTTCLLLSICGPPQVADDPLQEARPAQHWERVATVLGQQRDAWAADMQRIHTALLSRIEAEAPELRERLDPRPPSSREVGYGVLPELLANPPEASVQPRERRYSLEKISTSFAPTIRDAAILAARATEEPSAGLEELLGEYEGLKASLANLQDHLAYHEFWQASVAAIPQVYAKRAQTLEMVREWNSLRRSPGDGVRLGELEAGIRDRLTPFTRTPGLGITASPDAGSSLGVRVYTDLEDDSFLQIFATAVEDAWTHSAAAEASGLSVELELVRLEASALYPETPPTRGSSLDIEDHLQRFPAGALVLTTGAASTHAEVGRYIQLGSSPIRPRTLAHEFGHLLGFTDGYLRAVEGESTDPFGVLLIEWTGLFDDLMGDARRGRPTTGLFERLKEAYVQPQGNQPASERSLKTD